MASGNLQNYYRNEIDYIDKDALAGEALKYKIKTMRKTPAWSLQTGNPKDASLMLQWPVTTLNVAVTILLKHLYNFWKSLDLPLTNCDQRLICHLKNY